jgi:hypothetical protein
MHGKELHTISIPAKLNLCHKREVVMYYDLKEIRVLDGYKIFIRFEDEKQGTVDLSDIINRGGVFSKLKDRTIFQQAYVNKEWSALCWPGDIDIAPETLYEAISN